MRTRHFMTMAPSWIKQPFAQTSVGQSHTSAVGQGPHCRCGVLVDLAELMDTGVVIFANTFGSLVIFPFLPFMISDFFPDIPRDQLG